MKFVSKPLYKLVSYSLPLGRIVGTTYPTSSLIRNLGVTKDYESPSSRYYSIKTEYEYKHVNVQISPTTGTVSGDTSYCTYSKAEKTTNSSWTASSQTRTENFQIDFMTGKATGNCAFGGCYPSYSGGGHGEQEIDTIFHAIQYLHINILLMTIKNMMLDVPPKTINMDINSQFHVLGSFQNEHFPKFII